MKRKLKQHRLISANLASRIAEAYRVVRTNIQFASLENPVKTMLVTSTAPGEGKSTTVANLAIAFAQTGSKVLLIDADLRRPTLHKVFRLSNPVGLTNLLSQNVALEVALRDVGIDNLQVITSGPVPNNPTEVLGSTRMRELVKSLATTYDYILLDSPPALAVADAAVLSTVVDGVILVVANDEVSADKVQKVTAQLQGIKANILGVVLNGIEHDSREEYYYYYYGNKKAK